MFFAFDGGDGSGKSTQIRLFTRWLTEQGHEVVTCRDPGSTPLGEAIRRLLLDRDDLSIGRTSEMFLYMAARAQMVEEVIRPALEAGKVVVSDRFLLSNVVYQGCAGGLPVPTLREIGQTATEGILPHMTFVLDISLSQAAARRDRPLDRMEREGEEFHERVRRGFLEMAEQMPQETVVIDASGSIDQVQEHIRRAAEAVLKKTPETPRRNSEG
jgi:dTMP kinase